jgi:hypothetical protein
MPEFTVIGLYDDGEVFTDNVQAATAYDAMQNVASALNRLNRTVDLQILGAVEGEVDLIAACQESGKAAYAQDLTSDR